MTIDRLVQNVLDQCGAISGDLVRKDVLELLNQQWKPIEQYNKDNGLRIIGATTLIVVGDVYFGKSPILLLKMGDKDYVDDCLKDAWRYTVGNEKVEPHMIPTHYMDLPDVPT